MPLEIIIDEFRTDYPTVRKKLQFKLDISEWLCIKGSEKRQHNMNEKFVI